MIKFNQQIFYINYDRIDIELYKGSLIVKYIAGEQVIATEKVNHFEIGKILSLNISGKIKCIVGDA